MKCKADAFENEVEEEPYWEQGAALRHSTLIHMFQSQFDCPECPGSYCDLKNMSQVP